MKAFSDLEQSKKLAEILPIESADMYYPWYIEEDGDTIESGHRLTTPNVCGFTTHKINKMTLPCWSLAALINIIPQELFDGEYIINITEGIDNKWIITYDHYENRNHSFYGLSAGADNLVDACYEMIIKLHEQNLL